jgi:phosphohistidine phosphatase
MHVFLMRHGEATPEGVDPAQPLSARGQADVLTVARHLGALGCEAAEVLHSSKTRAHQTAEALSRHLVPSPSLREVNWLGPMTPPAFAQAELEAASAPLFLVGHLPHLARLASLLLAGEPALELVRFRPASVIRLDRTEGGWRLAWMLTPELVAPAAPR